MLTWLLGQLLEVGFSDTLHIVYNTLHTLSSVCMCQLDKQLALRSEINHLSNPRRLSVSITIPI